MKLLKARSAGYLEYLGHKRDVAVEFFKCVCYAVLSTTKQMPSSSIISQRRQTSLRPIYPKDNTHQSKYFEGTCPFQSVASFTNQELCH